jgi:hypothetical protein
MKTGRLNFLQASSLLGFTGLLAPAEPDSEETAAKDTSGVPAPKSRISVWNHALRTAHENQR